MKVIRIATATLLAAAVAAGCTEHPAAVQRLPPSRPAFEGGGYMGNGGSVPHPDTTRNEPAGTTSAPPPGAAPGGGYAGNGG